MQNYTVKKTVQGSTLCTIMICVGLSCLNRTFTCGKRTTLHVVMEPKFLVQDWIENPACDFQNKDFCPTSGVSFLRWTLYLAVLFCVSSLHVVSFFYPRQERHSGRRDSPPLPHVALICSDDRKLFPHTCDSDLFVCKMFKWTKIEAKGEKVSVSALQKQYCVYF